MIWDCGLLFSLDFLALPFGLEDARGFKAVASPVAAKARGHPAVGRPASTARLNLRLLGLIPRVGLA